VISRTPITGAAEWDLTGQGEHGDNFAPRPSSDQILTEELAIDVPLGPSRPSRGFLRVDLEDGPSVYAVHWKSSLGKSCNADDIDFARQREDQASGLIVDAQRILAEGRSVVVAGDYNIQAPGRVLRVGTSATEDCAPQGSCEGVCGPGGLDGYDDSIDALLALDNARLLSASLPETFIGQSFPGGAIDHILVAGSLADRFQDARTPDVSGTSFEGSDHRPVIAIFSTTSEETPGEKIRRLLDEIESRIAEIEELLQEQ
jgi:endonuclease/exonuclease/phosphatase family metal-dependent hydrolase